MENLIILEKAVYLFTCGLWMAYVVFGVLCFMNKYFLDRDGLKRFSIYKDVHKYLILGIVFVFAVYEFSPYGSLKEQIPSILVNMVMIILSFVFLKWVLSKNFSYLKGAEVSVYIFDVKENEFSYRVIYRRRCLCEQKIKDKRQVDALMPLEGEIYPAIVQKLHFVDNMPRIEVQILKD